MAKGKLFALIVVVGALGVVAATGAFTTVTAERTATINVSGDDAALLQMDPSDETDVVSMSDAGTIQIDISEDGGAGLNPVATTSFDPALNVTNQGSQDIGLSVDVSVDSSQFDSGDLPTGYATTGELADALANSTVIEIYNLDNGTVGDSEAVSAQLAGGGSHVVIDDDAPTDATAVLGTGEETTIAVAFDLTDNNGGEIPELDTENIQIAIEFEADADALNGN